MSASDDKKIADLFRESASKLYHAYRTALEVSCMDALAAAGGDLGRVERESSDRSFCDETIKVDGKPFRRVAIVAPSPGADDFVIRIVTTVLTKETT